MLSPPLRLDYEKRVLTNNVIRTNKNAVYVVLAGNASNYLRKEQITFDYTQKMNEYQIVLSISSAALLGMVRNKVHFDCDHSDYEMQTDQILDLQENLADLSVITEQISERRLRGDNCSPDDWACNNGFISTQEQFANIQKMISWTLRYNTRKSCATKGLPDNCRYLHIMQMLQPYIQREYFGLYSATFSDFEMALRLLIYDNDEA